MSKWLRSCVVLVVFCGIAVAQDSKSSGETKTTDPLKTWSDDAQAIVRKMARTIKSVKSYQDEGRFEYINPFGEGPGPDEVMEYKETVTLAQPNRVRVDELKGSFICDGKNVTFEIQNIQRYRSRPLTRGEKLGDVYSLLARVNSPSGIASIYLAEDPVKEFAELLIDMSVEGDQDIDGDKCVVLSGTFESPDRDMKYPVRFWLRKSDGLIRKIEFDYTCHMRDSLEWREKNYEEELAAANDPEHEEHGFYDQDYLEREKETIDRVRGLLEAGKKTLLIYHSGAITLNQKLEDSVFSYKPPARCRKANWIYHRWFHLEPTALPCELSGKPLPDFELKNLLDGKRISSETLKDKVALIRLMPFYQCGETIEDVVGKKSKLFADLYESLPESKRDQVQWLTIIHSAQEGQESVLQNMLKTIIANKTRETGKQPVPGSFALTNESVLADTLVNSLGGESTGDMILLVRNGEVQGFYFALGYEVENSHITQSLENDVVTMLSGKSLPAARPMTKEDVREMLTQLNPMFTTVSSVQDEDLVSPERLVESWRFPISHTSFSTSDSSTPSQYFWAKRGQYYHYIDAAGDMDASIREPRDADPESMWNQKRMIDFFGPGNDPAMVILAVDRDEETGETVGQAHLRFYDKDGERLWNLDLDGSKEEGYYETCIFHGNFDGIPGDEIGVQIGSVMCIVSSSGELLCSNAVLNFNSEIKVKDRDQDGVDEIYVREFHSLARFDYVPDAGQ